MNNRTLVHKNTRTVEQMNHLLFAELSHVITCFCVYMFKKRKWVNPWTIVMSITPSDSSARVVTVSGLNPRAFDSGTPHACHAVRKPHVQLSTPSCRWTSPTTSRVLTALPWNNLTRKGLKYEDHFESNHPNPVRTRPRRVLSVHDYWMGIGVRGILRGLKG